MRLELTVEEQAYLLKRLTISARHDSMARGHNTKQAPSETLLKKLLDQLAQTGGR